MVNLVDDWEVLEEYAGEKQGFYQLLGVDGAIEIRVCTGRLGFRKEFAVSRHVPYGNSAEFKKCISEADIPKLVRLVKLVGMLLQTKVYLSWRGLQNKH